MLLVPLALSSAAAAALVLPEISEADDGVVSILPINANAMGLASGASGETLRVPCPQCEGSNSHLSLSLSVDGTRLLINGFELYPNPDPTRGELTATLVDDADLKKDETLGFSLQVMPVAMDAYQQMQLIDVDLRILQVGKQFLDGIPMVKLQLIKTVTRDLTIANVGLLEEAPARCSALGCRAREIVGKMLQAFESAKGCIMRHGHRGPQAAVPSHSDAVVVPIHVGRPDKSSEASSEPTLEQPPQYHPDWRLLLKNVASQIFLPVLMGVTAGVGVAVLAMILCSVAIRLTECVKGRRAQRSSCCHKRALRQRHADAEKVGLMDEEAANEQAGARYTDEETSKN